jgi:hypothetical protein
MRITVGQLRRIIRETIEEETGRQHVQEGLLDNIKGLFGGGKINAIAQALFPDDVLKGGSEGGDETNLVQLRNDLARAGYSQDWVKEILGHMHYKFAAKNYDAKSVRVGDDLEFRRSLMKLTREKWLQWAKPGDKGMNAIKAEYSDFNPKDKDDVWQMRAFFTRKGAPGWELIKDVVIDENFGGNFAKKAEEKAKEDKARDVASREEFDRCWRAFSMWISENPRQNQNHPEARVFNQLGKNDTFMEKSNEFIRFCKAFDEINNKL